jgi:predicted RNase H-like HicB family nuclease
MTKDFQIIIERDADGWFVGSTPCLPGCHSQAKSLDVLMERMREAIALALEDQA